MQKLFIASICIVLGCTGPLTPSAPQQRVDPVINYVVISDSFDDLAAEARNWVAEIPSVGGAQVQLQRHDGNSFMSLTLPVSRDARELALRRSIDLTPVRGQRVRLSARVRIPTSATATARVRLSIPPLPGVHTYFDFADSAPHSKDSWAMKYVIIDVNKDATRGEIVLFLNGSGTAWFDDLQITSLGASPTVNAVSLSASRNEHLATLARAIALIRYFHPSDQSATLDWQAFSVLAVERLLAASDDSPMHAILSRMFSPVAPTVRFVKEDDRSEVTLQRDQAATHLVRWHHTGLGTEYPSELYGSFRDGIEAEEIAITHVRTTAVIPHLSTCRNAEIRAALTNVTGSAWVFAKLSQSANRTTYIRQAIPAQRDLQVVIARGEVPADTRQVQLGIFLAKRSSIHINHMSVSCENGETVRVDAKAAWELSRFQAQFRKEVINCGGGSCVAVSRVPPDTEEQPERDIARVDIGSGLHMLLPLAVWSNGKVTFPQLPATDVPPPTHTLTDLPTRLAAVATIWNTLLWFYPYLGDQQLDWPAMLRGALDEAAAASSPEAVHKALSRLVAGLQDGHARVRHPTRSMLGMLPLALRKFDQQIVIIGGLPEYMTSIPVGSELVSLDGVSTRSLYAESYSTVSASTPGFRDYLASLYVSLGPIGMLRHVQLKTPGGTEISMVIPLISREIFDQDIQLRRPRSGTEIAPAIFYVDPIRLEHATLPVLLQSLKTAKALVLDARGYTKNDALELLAHFIVHPVSSPKLQVPLVQFAPSHGFQDEGWLLQPAAPLLNCRIVVLTEARAISAAETLLQIIHDNHLATFVGEPTAGTNGDVNTFSVPGGFEVRFTGLRVSGPDDSTIQGRGIVPDHVVHPTLEGIRAGRDEILEAGLAIAQGLTPK